MSANSVMRRAGAARSRLNHYHTPMEVRLFPNSRRPGAGLKPRREATRPLLPQHARHCPVLEAGQRPRPDGLSAARAEGIGVRRARRGRPLQVHLLPADARRKAHADLPGHAEPVGGRGGMVQGRGDLRRRADAVSRGGVGGFAGLPRARGHGHTARRHCASWRHELPDDRRGGTRSTRPSST